MSASAPLKVYTEEEVAKHTSTSDCWMIMHGKVYDITKYLGNHPGGDELLMDNAGKDGTQEFEDMFHSESAVKQLQKYLIGTLDKGDHAVQHHIPIAAEALELAEGSLVPMNAEKFEKFKLVEIVNLSHDSAVFKFALPKDSKLNLPLGHHIQLCVPHNNDHIVRKYTPIKSSDMGCFDILIKRYDNGIASKHVHNMKVGDSLLMRGPFGSYELCSNKYSMLYMVAAGTGIAPMYQLIEALLNDSKNSTRIVLIYANKTVQDILLKKELEEFVKKEPLRFTIVHVLSREAEKPMDEPNITFKLGHVNESILSSTFYGSVQVTQALLCGPDQFCASMNELLEVNLKMPREHIHTF